MYLQSVVSHCSPLKHLTSLLLPSILEANICRLYNIRYKYLQYSLQLLLILQLILCRSEYSVSVCCNQNQVQLFCKTSTIFCPNLRYSIECKANKCRIKLFTQLQAYENQIYLFVPLRGFANIQLYHEITVTLNIQISP